MITDEQIREAAIEDAARKWVDGFMSEIPTGMIEALMEADREGWCEVTAPAVGDTVYVYDVSEGIKNDPDEDVDDEDEDEDLDKFEEYEDEQKGEIVDYNEEDDLYAIEMEESGRVLLFHAEDFEREEETELPMWGTMWRFKHPADDFWLENLDGIKAMTKCGFRVYKSDSFGYFFGIDGAGYDFYESHWIPLYKARGLLWHETPPARPAVHVAIAVEGGLVSEVYATEPVETHIYDLDNRDDRESNIRDLDAIANSPRWQKVV